MPSPDAVRQQILEVLASNQIAAQVDADGTITVPAPGEDTSTEVSIFISGEAEGLILVTFDAPILIGIAGDEGTRIKALELVNRLNIDSVFGRYTLETFESMNLIVMSHVMIGSDLQEAEIMQTLILVGAPADEADDLAKQELGSGETLREIAGSDEP